MSVDLVYDISCCNGSIKRCVDYIREIKDIYNLPLTLGKNVDPSGTIDIYFTSDDSEFFYKQVRTRFLDDTGNKYIYIILAHSPDRDREVKRILKNMKEKLKRKTKLSVDLEEIINRILPVGDVENISSWWPCVLQLACSKGRDGYKREIGVLFKIDDENEQQVEWMDDQFQVLEKHFRVKCRSAAEVFSEEKYIQNSACVVMYVSREQLAECRSGEENDGKEMIINKIKHTVDMCTRYNTKFLLYVEDANLETEVDLDIVGTDGLMSYWIALLNLLDIVRVDRCLDVTFHSDIRDEVTSARFNALKYDKIFPSHRYLPRPQTTRDIASPTGVNPKPSVQTGVTYCIRNAALTKQRPKPSQHSSICCWIN